MFVGVGGPYFCLVVGGDDFLNAVFGYFEGGGQ